ncbi:MAG: hypothetical protein A6F71_08385 [Cycloclasticus sp. symbiont of Poecilosclerida sp. M]|nr:MAG: hypothetical protein A6F71_08385 [Cycloclasticus sp. symbiont of Poecilosclerida sp. M]
MSLKLPLSFLLVLFCVACANVQEKSVQVNEMVDISAVADKPEVAVVELKPEPKAAETDLDPNVLFNLLGGEIAGQRGEINYATHFYVNAAKLSGDTTVALRAVQIALFNKDIKSAASIIDILMKQESPSASVRRLALTVYLRSGDVQNSLQQTRELISMSDIPYRNTVLALGDLIARSADRKTAYEVIKDVIADKSKEAAGYLARSQIAFRFKDLKQARVDAQKAVQLGADWKVTYAQYAQVLEANGESAKALAVLKEATVRFPDAPLRMGYGQLLAKNELYEQATGQFEKLLAKDKSYHEARFSLGLVYLKRDMPELAKEAFKQLYESAVFTAKSAFYLGGIYFVEKDYKAAASWFSKVEEGPLYLDAQANVVMVKAKLGDLGGAQKLLLALREKFPDKATRFYMLEGEVLYQADDYLGSFNIMTEAVKKEPTNMILRYTRAIAASEINRLDVMEQDLRLVLNKQPDNVSAMNALGFTLASKTTRFEEAGVLLEKAISFRPEDPAILDSLGWLKYRTGAFKEALALLKKAYAINPDAEIASHLGDTLWELGRKDEAKQLWREAVKRNPGSRFLKRAKQKLK